MSSMKVYHIEWLDSETLEGWTALSDVEAELSVTHTIGFLIHESNEFLLVAHSYDPGTESTNGLITIPKAAIKKSRTLCRVKV
jgi:hypothetical protein